MKISTVATFIIIVLLHTFHRVHAEEIAYQRGYDGSTIWLTDDAGNCPKNWHITRTVDKNKVLIAEGCWVPNKDAVPLDYISIDDYEFEGRYKKIIVGRSVQSMPKGTIFKPTDLVHRVYHGVTWDAMATDLVDSFTPTQYLKDLTAKNKEPATLISK